MSREADSGATFGRLSPYFGEVRNADCDHVPAPAEHAPRLEGDTYGDGALVIFDDPGSGAWIDCGNPRSVER